MNHEITPPLDVLMAASLYLMTRHAEERRWPSTSSGSEYPECARSPLARASAYLSQQWHWLARRTALH
jgi:hypothetical protein